MAFEWMHSVTWPKDGNLSMSRLGAIDSIPIWTNNENVTLKLFFIIK